ILNKNVIIVDVRNSYEYRIGHFKNSINIFANTFREQLHKIVFNLIKFKNKNIIMYCTGGIRCEKATAWLMYHGFNKVFHIKGGIIGYVNHAKKNKLPIFFKGKNFVFDLRMFEKITDDVLGSCYHCKKPYDIYINCKHSKCNLLFIQCLVCKTKYHDYCSLKCLYM
ncbi:rhodanese-related sulfurtransferase, partial [Buchnera aphidicola (Hormaphis cornu)]